MKTPRNVLVAGASSGIGEAIARAFAEQGDTVTATGATEAEVNAAMGRNDPSVRFVQLDVRDGPAVTALVSALGDLDVLVNCAGIIRRGQEHDPEVFEQVLDINLVGTMRLCAAARDGLANKGGCIINTASMLSFFGAGLCPPTAPAKGASPS